MHRAWRVCVRRSSFSRALDKIETAINEKNISNKPRPNFVHPEVTAALQSSLGWVSDQNKDSIGSDESLLISQQIQSELQNSSFALFAPEDAAAASQSAPLDAIPTFLPTNTNTSRTVGARPTKTLRGYVCIPIGPSCASDNTNTIQNKIDNNSSDSTVTQSETDIFTKSFLLPTQTTTDQVVPECVRTDPLLSHVSLSRTFLVKPYQTDSFVGLLRYRISTIPRFAMTFQNTASFPSEDNTKMFVGACLKQGTDSVRELVTAVNDVLRAHRIAEIFEDRQPHVTLGWSSRIHFRKDITPLFHTPESSTVGASCVIVRIGNRIFRFQLPLPVDPTTAVDRKSNPIDPLKNILETFPIPPCSSSSSSSN
eukprot:c3839_g1_i1.p1 GENE.c3839_g1_i1~~c3839_g1_i1.p1  ORF type:complete len:368 (-),score=74.89 c3839_g1_i1:276-1379(-)